MEFYFPLRSDSPFPPLCIHPGNTGHSPVKQLKTTRKSLIPKHTIRTKQRKEQLPMDPTLKSPVKKSGVP